MSIQAGEEREERSVSQARGRGGNSGKAQAGSRQVRGGRQKEGRQAESVRQKSGLWWQQQLLSI